MNGIAPFVEAHLDCTRTFLKNTRTYLYQRLRLDLLQTCRQIYHDAVLTPFSVNEFDFVVDSSGLDRKLQCLFDVMVPTQVRAIKKLRFVCVDAAFPSHTVIQQLKGLDDLDIHIVLKEDYLANYFEGDVWKLLEHFSAKLGVEALARLPLKSLRITGEVQPVRVTFKDTHTSAIGAWLERLETKLLNSTAD